MKTCSDCKKDKELEDFHIDRSSKTGRASKCKDCAKLSSKRWYQTSEKYREIIRDSGLKLRFGISSADYWQLSEDQNHVCAICGKSTEKYLHVDHNHETGEIRGLLCKNCNHGLGNFKDNPEFLQEAIRYLSIENVPVNDFV